MDTSDYIFLAVYWFGVIRWSLKNKDKAKRELLQIKDNWKKGILILLLVLFPFIVVLLMTYVF